MDTDSNNRNAKMTQLMSSIDEIERANQKKSQVLSELLAEQLSDETQVPVTALHMGSTISYIGSVTLPWINRHVALFTELPLMRNRIDNGRLVVDEEILDDLQQRAPDWSRQAILVHYLIGSRARKFPPLLVVVSEPWVDDVNAKEWDAQGRATKTSIPFISLDQHDRIGKVDFCDGIIACAADGQHRLLGIKGVMEIVQNGFLRLVRKDQKQTGAESRDFLLKRFGITDADLMTLLRESVGVEFIPAVVKGETREEARRRIRSIFVHVNKNAKPLALGELTLLDEDNGFAIVARRVGLHEPLFRRDKPGDRVNWKSSALPARGIWLTTAAALKDMTQGYLEGAEQFLNWKPISKDELPMRPDEIELEQGEQKMRELFHYISELPSFGDIRRGGNVDSWRDFPSKDDKGRKGHLLMRPLGQVVLAEALGWLHTHQEGPLLSLDLLFEKLKDYDDKGGFEMTKPDSAWYGITYEPTRERISTAGRSTARQMLIYLLNGLNPSDRKKLLEEFRRLRTIERREGEKSLFMNFNGQVVNSEREIQLPPMI